MKHLTLKLITVFTMIFGVVLISQAQEIEGSWKGNLSVQGTELPLVFHISGEGEELSSTMDSPSQGATGIPMDVTTFEENVLTIKFNQAGIKFVNQRPYTNHGTLNA